MTDIKGLRAAMHAAVDGEQASADEMIIQVMRRHRRHRRHSALAGVAALIALAVAVPVAIAVHGALSKSGPRPSLEHPTPPPHRLPTRMTGLPMPAGTDFQVLIGVDVGNGVGNGAAWYSTAARRAERIGGLPRRSQGGYQFSRVYGGWVAAPSQTWSSSCPPHGIDACAGRPTQFYFIADGSLTATRIGAGFWADGVAASSRPGAVWLDTYPRATAKLTGSGYAQLVSTTGQPLGPRYRLPANYLLGPGVGSDLLLVNNRYQNQDILWDPRTGRVLRHFGNVLATGPERIAWSPGCRGCRVQILNVSTGTTVTLPLPGRNAASLGAAFSDDGRLLAVQAPGQQIEVYDTATRTLTAIPGTALSGADWQNFGWHAGGHRLVIAAGPNTIAGPAQLAYWQPGAAALRLGTVRNLRELTELQIGQLG